MKKVILFGSTGAIGSALKECLLKQELDLTAFVRKATNSSPNEHFEEVVVNFDQLESIQRNANAVFIALGTTIKKAGSADAFKAVDRDLVIRIALWAKSQGIPEIHLVSSIGTSANAKGLYLQTKYEVENAIETLGFDTIHIYRPSLLIADRGCEKRFGESVSVPFMKMISHLGGKMKKYRPITVEKVAAFMSSQLGKGLSDVYIYESDQMQ
ncbi:NAD(P)H-binding protein [Halosquirtibacter laminarini]|uniref:NAD(P)H-binding protein n=1 Tax=Halosquirtibacter laminarini TaxID=3374600 RepID=A0AC61NPE4_9BACT|nr:NAD(P)H-binding protein [Prolixibacteraceae bacterium]